MCKKNTAKSETDCKNYLKQKRIFYQKKIDISAKLNIKIFFQTARVVEGKNEAKLNVTEICVESFGELLAYVGAQHASCCTHANFARYNCIKLQFFSMLF